jgi:hypothetical protein
MEKINRCNGFQGKYANFVCRKLPKNFPGYLGNKHHLGNVEGLRPVLNFAPRAKFDPEGRFVPSFF